MKTFLLLLCSNVFMTFAWYGHLKFFHGWSLPLTIVLSWGIALFEYMLMVPANRIGYAEEGYNAFQLKILQEIITISVFIVFASLILKERIKWNHAVSFLLILAAVGFAFYDISSDPQEAR
ncbi:DMT family protein [Leptospira sp. FAT2]|uniref:DMT family protein n=1 Tax=Leptospira sanjuanensis TaxID=2879643 RepID=UPI001EE84B95|nr:DMT family protein [Leptospira sanjuanensis]MCG6167575.1 DMT family protein [Leptospira sanjuanensis]MCG6192994.1 DMT family protein [Leptospira sanjuanensis]